MENQIPIRNIYFMLIYAWKRLDSSDIVSISQLDICTSTIELFTRILLNGFNKIYKQGLDRSYKVKTEFIQNLRGKICFENSLLNQATRKLAMNCEFEELSYDILHNQIIAATVKNLLSISTKNLSKEYRQQLESISKKMKQITLIRLTRGHFDRVQLHSNNSAYTLLVDVCRLIFDSLLVSEETGQIAFNDFVRDENKMRKLFEDFLRNFYRQNQNEFQVGAKKLSFNSEINNEIIPGMETDIILENKEQAIIIDAKYYKSVLQQGRFGKSTIRSNHIYQLNAYLSAYEKRFNRKPKGFLIYPTVKDHVHFQAEILGYQQHYHTIDLSRDWQHISEQLLGLIGHKKNN